MAKLTSNIMVFMFVVSLTFVSIGVLSDEGWCGEVQAGFVEIDVGTVGALLDGTLKRGGLFMFEGLPEDTRRRLVRQLSRSASVRIIERALRSTDGTIVLDPHWMPWPAIVGKSAGRIAASDLGVGNDIVYSIETEVFDFRLDEGGGRRQLVDMHLRLAGEGLGIPHRDSVRATFRWQFAVVTPIATVKDKLRNREDRHQERRLPSSQR